MHLRADKISGLNRSYVFANAFHNAAKLMPQSYRRLDPPLRPSVPSIDMQIRPANRSRLHAHQNVCRTDRRHRRAFERQPAPRAHLPQRLHSRSHLSRPSLMTQSPMLAQPTSPATPCPRALHRATAFPISYLEFRSYLRFTAKSPPKPTHWSAAPSLPRPPPPKSSPPPKPQT